MNTRRTGLIILLVVFVGLLMLTLAQPPQESNQPLTPVTPFYRVFPDLAVLDIVGMRLRSPEAGDTLVLVRDAAGNWQAPDLEGTLEENAGTALARTMALLPFTSETPLGDDLSIYGFQPEGILSVEIVLIDGASHVIAVGFRTPTEQGYYALVDEQPSLYILDRAPIDYLISQLRNPPVA